MSRAVSPLLASPSSIIRSRASGIEAAEVLPGSAMSRAIVDVLGQLHRARHRVDDPHVGLVRDEHVEVVDGDPGRVQRLLGDLGHLERRPSGRPRLPCMTRCGIAGLVLRPARRASPRVCRIRSDCSPSEPQTTGPMPGVVGWARRRPRRRRRRR